MRKLLGLIGIGVIGLLLPNLAFAQEASMDVELNLPSTYTVTIPANQEIQFKQIMTKLETPLVVEGNIAPDKKVQVKVELQSFIHKELPNSTLEFQLWDQKSHEWKGTNCFAKDLENNQQKRIFLNLVISEEVWQKAEPGTYEGSIIFTSSIQESTGAEDD